MAGGWEEWTDDDGELMGGDEIVQEEIVITLLHELGHHFGLDEDDLNGWDTPDGQKAGSESPPNSTAPKSRSMRGGSGLNGRYRTRTQHLTGVIRAF